MVVVVHWPGSEHKEVLLNGLNKGCIKVLFKGLVVGLVEMVVIGMGGLSFDIRGVFDTRLVVVVVHWPGSEHKEVLLNGLNKGCIKVLFNATTSFCSNMRLLSITNESVIIVDTKNINVVGIS
jgi:hypothetical protein